jgi:Enoyl-(Acyl carrier protein) reductase
MTGPILENAEATPWITAHQPFRGPGETKDIARAALFLASEDAGWVTGIGLPVDGGFVSHWRPNPQLQISAFSCSYSHRHGSQAPANVVEDDRLMIFDMMRRVNVTSVGLTNANLSVS